ncbi:CDP-diacylglycerol--glycerol-3-phosphate 3-phosphatidyltransferase [Nitrospira sp.]|nr:CDP-diacylglycerol--glycerol-3-phosphate 3-phosphatidyltransferase [Nitrospira sp.]
MNLPNSLTALRILMIPVFVGLLVYDQPDRALIVLVLAGITDALDGAIARVTNQRTPLGEVLDPLADKLLLVAGFVTLSVLHMVPSWVAIVVVSRDLILIIGTMVARLTDSPLDIKPTILGKGTTALQLLYLVLVLLVASGGYDIAYLNPLLFLMVLVTLSSGFHYLYRGFLRGGTREA